MPNLPREPTSDTAGLQLHDAAAQDTSFKLQSREDLISTLIEDLSSGFDLSPSVRLLTDMGEKAVPALAKALSHENYNIRQAAAEVLSDIGPGAQEAVPALIKALKQLKDQELCYKAANALGEIGAAAKKAVPALADALSDDDYFIRHAAANALGEIGLAAKKAVHSLANALRDPEEEVRYAAANALGEIGPGAKEAVPALIKALKDGDDDVREAASHALGEIGPATAKEAVPALTEVLNHDPVEWVRHVAAYALAKINPQPE